MRYIVADLLKRSTGASRVIELEDPLGLSEAGIVLTAPVTGRLRFVRDHAGILVQGRLSTVASLECARCLAPAAATIEFELVEHFRPTIALPEGPAIVRDPNEEDEPATEIDAHHVLDLTTVIEQNILLNVPLHPLCRPECRGLCPTCGHDRNDGPCDCPPPQDPRWDDLRALIRTPNGARDPERERS